MQAYMFSDDKLSCEVLTRALKEQQFTDVTNFRPDPSVKQDFRAMGVDTVVFMDFDAARADEMLVHLPLGLTIVGFGSHQRRARATAAGLKTYLGKPFTREQVTKATAEALRSDNELPAPRARSSGWNSATDHPALLAEWKQILEVVARRRQELDRLVNATPEQLKVLLMGKVTFGPNGEPQVPPDALPMQTALIIEQDASFARILTRYLAEKCVLQADVAPDGATGWQYMKSRRYDAIILQWEVKDPSGLALYNRLRSAPATRYQPLIVISSTVKEQDFRLLDEDFAVALVPQPVQPKAFSQSLSRVVVSAVLSKEFLAELTDLVCRSIDSDLFKAHKLGHLAEGAPEVLLNALKLGGDRFLEKEAYASAEAAYTTAWQLGDRRLSLLTGYGKACYLGGRADEALKLLSAADTLAPNCVERLCLLGEVNMARQGLDAARANFQQALKIDPGVKKGHAGLEVANAIEAADASDELDGITPVSGFAAYLNLVGINLSRTGKLEQALHYYRSAMTFVHGKDSQAKLWFNIGICFLRAHKPDQATGAFQKASELSEGKLAKAQKYLKPGDKPVVRAEEADIEFERF